MVRSLGRAAAQMDRLGLHGLDSALPLPRPRYARRISPLPTDGALRRVTNNDRTEPFSPAPRFGRFANLAF
jgi:hypothetical protein